MTLCKFYQQGYCRYGNNCRFEHANAGNSNAANRNQPANRFGALAGANNTQSPSDKYYITADVIERDLTSETPQWVLSCYCPGRDAPGQLFGGYPREQSFEEMHLHFYEAKASGTEQQALNDAQQLYSNSQQQMRNAATNTKDAIQFILSAENNHPNRLDICEQGTQGAPFDEFLVGKRPNALILDSTTPFGSKNNASLFGGGASTIQTGTAFGQPSTLGQKPNPFGTPAFGQPSQPASTLGQTGAQGASPFGQSSQPTSTFGQPSQPTPAFGQPSQPTPAFGQPSQPTSTFGQASTLGAKPNPFGAPSFGTPAQPSSQVSAFGQPSQIGQKPNPFGTPTNNNASPFAAAGANNNTTNTSPFGASSGQNQAASPFANNQNQNANGSSPFGQPSQTSSPFAKPPLPPSPNPFASTNKPTNNANNPFAQAQQQQTQPQTNGFAAQPNLGQTSNAAPATQNAAGSSGNPYPPGSSNVHPPIESYSAKDMTGRLSMFKGKPVTYKDGKPGIRQFDGSWRRIWFPNGPPAYSRDTELPLEQYDDKSKAQWASFRQTGTFQDGAMPELPPPRDNTLWDF